MFLMGGPHASHEIWVLPWVDLSDDIEFDGLLIQRRPLTLDDDCAIVPADDMPGKLMHIFKAPNGMPVDTVSTIGSKDEPYSILDDASGIRNRIRFAARALAFCGITGTIHQRISTGNESLFPPGIERFQLLRYFVEGNGIAFATTATAHWTSLTSGSGYSVTRPEYLPKSMMKVDRHLLEALGKFAAVHCETPEWRKWARVFQWVASAMSTSDAFGEESRLVMMVSAAEFLFGREASARKLADEFSKALGWIGLPTTEVFEPPKKHIRTRPYDWVCKIYELRNQAAHNQGIPDSAHYFPSPPLMHKWILAWLMREVIVLRLVELEFYPDLQDQADTEGLMLECLLRENKRCYEKLGWLAS